MHLCLSMQGFQSLLTAMVLKPVDKLSDEEAPNKPTTPKKGEQGKMLPKSKPKAKGKAKPASSGSTPKKENQSKSPAKKPAGAIPMKRPASKESDEQPLKVYKCQYKNGKFGFKWNNREQYSVAHLQPMAFCNMFVFVFWKVNTI